MVNNELNFSSQCPLIEEFHIKNIVAGVERKQWAMGGRVTLDGAGEYAVAFLVFSGGIIQNMTSYHVLAQKLNAVPVEEAYVSAKTTAGFTIKGDAASLNSIIVLGEEPTRKPALLSQRKWAKDYCPYCKSQNISAIVGATVKDQVMFGFQATTGAGGSVAVLFRTVMRYINLFGLPAGQHKDPLLTSMADATYQISITKAAVGTGAAVVIPPYASAINREGFTLNGDASKTYDVLILGQILY
jgi:hypothetical protein